MKQLNNLIWIKAVLGFIFSLGGWIALMFFNWKIGIALFFWMWGENLLKSARDLKELNKIIHDDIERDW